MKKFSEFKFSKKINEQEITLGQTTNAEENTPTKSVDPYVSTTKELVDSNSDSNEVVKTDAAKFFSKLLESREMAQVYHWTVKGDMGSHAAHLALEAYYDGVIEFIDELVEVYQGQYELIEGYDVIDTTDSKTKDKLDYFKEIAEFIRKERNTCLSKEDTHLQNVVDEVLALVYKTLYKLKYNK
jgi:DNA-binding ferritin-like protein